MDFERNNLRRRLMPPIEDRLSSLPDELIQHIFSFIDTKFVVQTCLLFPRWNILWRSMPYLTFTSHEFDSLHSFSKFVTNVLSRRDHQIDVFLVKLSFNRAASQPFVSLIARYAFSHNVQQLTVISSPMNNQRLPLCLFKGSKSLKHFTFRSTDYSAYSSTLAETPWDFSVLISLNLSNVSWWPNDKQSNDLFSKCVNLKDLTLNNFRYSGGNAVFDIITPRLENLMLIKCSFGWLVDVVNVIAPQIKNLIVINCRIQGLNIAPSQISNFCFKNKHPLQLPKDCFHSLNKVTLSLNLSRSNMLYNEEESRATINMLQELHSARFLTVNLDIVECLSSFPDLVAQHPSPFINLICLNIDSSREEAYKVKLSAEALNYLLKNSPNATFINDLPEEPFTKEMIEKEASEKKAKLITEIKTRMKELQNSVKQEIMQHIKRNLDKEHTKALFGNLVANLLQVLTMKKMMQSDSNQIEAELARLTQRIQACVGRLQDLYQQVYKNFEAIHSKEMQIISLLRNLPTSQRIKYSQQLKVTEILDARLLSTLEDVCSCKKKIVDVYKEHVSHNISTFQDISRVAEDWAKRSSSHNIS
uniref:putative F-box/LRR-repeat protein At5g02930 n=1 Tax=Erigeron canadensis TaxID=72917 RepID=UPI001CB98495|nr:putative F-box/LRR-repeat protein At5g02930 [Erigeron canadensis]